MNDRLINVWRNITVGNDMSWVLFDNGTCVFLMTPEDDLSAQAVELMKEWGPVLEGCPAGDFGVMTLTNGTGWLVTSHHNDILTYVDREELGDAPSNTSVGFFGRSKRDQDAETLTVIHVEDKRKTA